MKTKNKNKKKSVCGALLLIKSLFVLKLKKGNILLLSYYIMIFYCHAHQQFEKASTSLLL